MSLDVPFSAPALGQFSRQLVRSPVLDRRPGPGALRLFSAHQRPPWRYRGPVPTLARSPPWLYARCDRDLFQDGTGDRSPEPTLFPISSDFCRFSAGAACRLSNRLENRMALNGTFGRSGVLYVLEGGAQKSEDRVRISAQAKYHLPPGGGLRQLAPWCSTPTARSARCC